MISVNSTSPVRGSGVKFLPIAFRFHSFVEYTKAEYKRYLVLADIAFLYSTSSLASSISEIWSRSGEFDDEDAISGVNTIRESGGREEPRDNSALPRRKLMVKTYLWTGFR